MRADIIDFNRRRAAKEDKTEIVGEITNALLYNVREGDVVEVNGQRVRDPGDDTLQEGEAFSDDLRVVFCGEAKGDKDDNDTVAAAQAKVLGDFNERVDSLFVDLDEVRSEAKPREFRVWGRDETVKIRVL